MRTGLPGKGWLAVLALGAALAACAGCYTKTVTAYTVMENGGAQVEWKERHLFEPPGWRGSPMPVPRASRPGVRKSEGDAGCRS